MSPHFLFEQDFVQTLWRQFLAGWGGVRTFDVGKAGLWMDLDGRPNERLTDVARTVRPFRSKPPSSSLNFSRSAWLGDSLLRRNYRDFR
jgi:hypothetical protein